MIFKSPATKKLFLFMRKADHCRLLRHGFYKRKPTHVAKKLRKRLSNVRRPRKAKKPQQEVSSDISATVYDGDSSASTIILERSPVSPKGIPVDLSPRTSTPTQNRDSDEECMYCIKFNLSPFHHNISVMSSACSADIMEIKKIQASTTRPSKKCPSPKSQTKLQ